MPDPAIPRDAYLVLVAGVMNPATHHPQWYHSIGAIDADELSASLRNSNSGTTPFASRVEFGSPRLVVLCQPNIWTIQSTDATSWGRMLGIASMVFAKSRNPTIGAYGLMAQKHIDTERNVKAILSGSVKSLNFGFPAGEHANTKVTVAIPGEGFTTTISVESSVIGDKAVFGLFHCDYPAPEVESINDGRFTIFAERSETFFADVVAAINSHAEEGGSHEQ
jgi:hypothetical protein